MALFGNWNNNNNRDNGRSGAKMTNPSTLAPRTENGQKRPQLSVKLVFKTPLADGTTHIVLHYRKTEDFLRQFKAFEDENAWGLFEDMYGRAEIVTLRDIGRIHPIERT